MRTKYFDYYRALHILKDKGFLSRHISLPRHDRLEGGKKPPRRPAAAVLSCPMLYILPLKHYLYTCTVYSSPKKKVKAKP